MDGPHTGGKVESTVKSTKVADAAKNGRSASHDGSVEGARSVTQQDSWVDAVITLLATVAFGLGWAWVELERADPPLNRYAETASEMWVGAIATSMENRALEARAVETVPAGRPGEEDVRWTELALQRSNR